MSKQSLPVIHTKITQSANKQKKPTKCSVTICYKHGPPSHANFDDFREGLKFAREACGWVELGTRDKMPKLPGGWKGPFEAFQYDGSWHVSIRLPLTAIRPLHVGQEGER